MKNFIKVILSILAIFLATALPVKSEEFSFNYQKLINIQKPVLIDLEMVRGAIMVTGTDDNLITIDAIKMVRASSRSEAEEIAAHIEIKIRESKDKVRIQTNYLNLINRSPSFWNKIIGGGDKVISEVLYKISLPFNCGLRIKALDADIELTNVESNIYIEKSAGLTKAEFILGELEIHQPLGEIDLQWIEGDIKINSKSSKIFIRQTRGTIKLSTYNGNVDIQTEFESSNDYIVETSSGNVIFSVPISAAGELHLETITGEFSSEIPVEVISLARNRMVGIFGGGGTKVKIISASGKVVLAQF
ncbi:MAG: hypothetical protein IIC66_05710 [candidate division Zixibacteria bacterium]|nr:hypothetical protein [candidate division Zixibacteria bacterium]